MILQSKTKFFLSIVLPSLSAVALFILSMFFIFLPAVESSMLSGKRELISEQTNTVWSLVNEYYSEVNEGQLSLEEAQALALNRVSHIRYGAEQKDYFWIATQEPRMLMHPYRPELNSSNLEDYRDPNGKRVFVEAVEVVSERNQGFIDYMWQWKDKPELVVPKLSFVQGFEPWGWMIGTGVYLDDVEREINALRKNLIRISFLIAVFISVISLFVVKQSLTIERKRQSLTNDLKQSKKKYKTLVEESSQGILMFVDDQLTFSNKKFEKISGLRFKDIDGKTPEELLDLSWPSVVRQLHTTSSTFTLETRITGLGTNTPVVAYISRTSSKTQRGFILSIKEVSSRLAFSQEKEKVATDIQSSLSLMEQPIAPYINEILTCSSELSIEQAASLLTRKKERCVFVTQNNRIIGIVTENDFLARSLAISKSPHSPITDIMSAPVASIPDQAFLYQALLSFEENKIEFLATTSHDSNINGVISHRDLSVIQHNTFSYLAHQIQAAENIDSLVTLHKKVPSLVLALLDSGNKSENITRLISSLSDTFTQKLIAFGLEKLGPAPCRFAFIAMGSEGRQEQTLSTDQDNAIIYDDISGEQAEHAEQYFLQLGEFMAYSLDEIGYNYCKGGIMACNKKWNQQLSSWKAYFDNWVNSQDIEDIVNANIFYDFRHIYGDQNLTQQLKKHVTRSAEQSPGFIQSLAASLGHYKSALSNFGKIVNNEVGSKENTVDIKFAISPLVKYGRLLALKHGVEETNTVHRIKKTFNSNETSTEAFDSISFCYNYLMQLRFKRQAEALLRGETPTNKVDISELNEFESSTLIKIFSEIDKLVGRVKSEAA